MQVIRTERAERDRGVMKQAGMATALCFKDVPRTGHIQRKSQDDALLTFSVILVKSKGKM